MADNDIRGTVTDQNGNPIDGAVVEVVEQTTDTETSSVPAARTVTDANGDYVIDGSLISGTGPWHVMYRWDDGVDQYQFKSNPYVQADTSAAVIPDSGFDHWYDAREASDISTIPDQIGSNDLSPNGSPSLTTGINNQQTILYDGTDDEHLSSTPASLGSNSEYTVAGVAKAETDNASNQTVVGNGNTSSGYSLRFDNESDGDFQSIHDGVAAQTGGTGDTNPHIFIQTYDGSNLITEIDGTEIINAALTSPNSPTGAISFGSRNGETFANAQVAEVGYAPQFSDSSKRSDLNNYFSSEWGIAI